MKRRLKQKSPLLLQKKAHFLKSQISLKTFTTKWMKERNLVKRVDISFITNKQLTFYLIYYYGTNAIQTGAE